METDNCVKYFGVSSKEIVSNYKSLKLNPKEMILILGVLKYGYIFISTPHDIENVLYEITSLGIPKEFIDDSNKIVFSDKDIDKVKNRIIEIKRRGLWKD